MKRSCSVIALLLLVMTGCKRGGEAESTSGLLYPYPRLDSTALPPAPPPKDEEKGLRVFSFDSREVPAETSDDSFPARQADRHKILEQMRKAAAEAEPGSVDDLSEEDLEELSKLDEIIPL